MRTFDLTGPHLHADLSVAERDLPFGAADFLAELDQLPVAEVRATQRLRVQVESFDSCTLTISHDTEFHRTPGRITLLWRHGGVLVADAGSGEISLRLDRGGDNAGWMLRTIVGTIAAFSGRVMGLHAAQVTAEDGWRTLLCGLGGSGKTSLSLWLKARGFSVEAEDFVYIDNHARPLETPVRNFFTLRLGTWRRQGHQLPFISTDFEAVERALISSVGHQIRMPTGLLAGSSSTVHTGIDTCVFLTADFKQDATVVSPMSAVDGFARLPEMTEVAMIEWVGEGLTAPAPLRPLVPEAARRWLYADLHLGRDWETSLDEQIFTREPHGALR